MKVLYCGTNTFGQFHIGLANADLCARKLLPVELPEECTYFGIAYSYNVFSSNEKLYIRGFVNGAPHQDYASTFDARQIQQISCNDSHILILTKSRCIYKIDVQHADFPVQIPNFLTTECEESPAEEIPDAVRKICAGRSMNLAVTTRGDLYSIPTKIGDGEKLKILDVACGREHGILLTEDGLVYTWGVGSRGQLGHGEIEDETEPQLVEALCGIKIIKIAAGGWHCAVISGDGDLYTWGWNVNGQLGFYNDAIVNPEKVAFTERDLTESISVMPVPRVVDVSESIDVVVTDVGCGARHTIVLTGDGSIYGTGANKYGQLGEGAPGVENICQMTLVTRQMKGIDKTRIICGQYATVVISE